MSDVARSETGAAEYALGLLEVHELQAAHHRAKTDPAYAAQVARWRGQLAALADEVPVLQAPPAAWQRIESSLAFDRGDNVVEFRRRLNLWRGATATATAIAASLALVLVTR